MKRAIGGARWMVLVAVVAGLLAAGAAFVWGAALVVHALARLGHGDLDGMGVDLVHVMDAFLVAAGLLVFALGLFELFVGGLALPPSLLVNDLGALESKLAGIVVLALAVAFFEKVERGAEARDALYLGLGVAPVAAVLVALIKKS